MKYYIEVDRTGTAELEVFRIYRISCCGLKQEFVEEASSIELAHNMVNADILRHYNIEIEIINLYGEEDK